MRGRDRTCEKKSFLLCCLALFYKLSRLFSGGWPIWRMVILARIISYELIISVIRE